jgi:hypothetical protein
MKNYAEWLKEHQQLREEYYCEREKYINKYCGYVAILALCFFVFAIIAPIAWMHAFPPADSLFDKLPLSISGHIMLYLLLPIALFCLIAGTYVGILAFRLKSPSNSKIYKHLHQFRS